MFDRNLICKILLGFSDCIWNRFSTCVVRYGKFCLNYEILKLLNFFKLSLHSKSWGFLRISIKNYFRLSKKVEKHWRVEYCKCSVNNVEHFYLDLCHVRSLSFLKEHFNGIIFWLICNSMEWKPKRATWWISFNKLFLWYHFLLLRFIRLKLNALVNYFCITAFALWHCYNVHLHSESIRDLVAFKCNINLHRIK